MAALSFASRMMASKYPTIPLRKMTIFNIDFIYFVLPYLGTVLVTGSSQFLKCQILILCNSFVIQVVSSGHSPTLPVSDAHLCDIYFVSLFL